MPSRRGRGAATSSRTTRRLRLLRSHSARRRPYRGKVRALAEESGRTSARLLFMKREDILLGNAADVGEASYPSALEVNGLTVPLAYRFDPGHEEDGITATLPWPRSIASIPRPSIGSSRDFSRRRSRRSSKRFPRRYARTSCPSRHRGARCRAAAGRGGHATDGGPRDPSRKRDEGARPAGSLSPRRARPVPHDELPASSIPTARWWPHLATSHL